MSKLTTFELNGTSKNINFIETQQVKDGVSCDVYEFVDDNSCDLGIITVRAGMATPKQKVLSGEKTIEGFISGEGSLEISRADGNQYKYHFPGRLVETELHIGDTMQWRAKEDLTCYEVCYPAYQDGRFHNID